MGLVVVLLMLVVLFVTAFLAVGLVLACAVGMVAMARAMWWWAQEDPPKVI